METISDAVIIDQSTHGTETAPFTVLLTDRERDTTIPIATFAHASAAAVYAANVIAVLRSWNGIAR